MIDKSSDLNKYLNKSEIDNLEYLNKKSNNIQDLKYKDSDIMNSSLNQVITQWSNVNIEVFNELVEFISNLKKYSSYFDDIDKTDNIITGFVKLIGDLLKILSKNDRGIYVGITFIMLSFLLYFIGISS